MTTLISTFTLFKYHSQTSNHTKSHLLHQHLGAWGGNGAQELMTNKEQHINGQPDSRVTGWVEGQRAVCNSVLTLLPKLGLERFLKDVVLKFQYNFEYQKQRDLGQKQMTRFCS